MAGPTGFPDELDPRLTISVETASGSPRPFHGASRRRSFHGQTAQHQPTDAELEILKVLWDRGPAGLGQIHAEIQEGRPVALTTIATTLKTMLAKGLVVRV